VTIAEIREFYHSLTATCTFYVSSRQSKKMCHIKPLCDCHGHRSDAAIRGEEYRNIQIRNANAASQAVRWQCTRVDESANGASGRVEELRGFINCPELGERSTMCGPF
jgi:hypothetical protein